MFALMFRRKLSTPIVCPSRNPLKAGPVDDAQKIFSRKLLVTSVLCLSMNICSEIE